MSIYTGIPPDVLAERLSAAQTAYDALATGQNVVSVAMGDKRVAYAAGDPAALSRLAGYIRDLQHALGLTGPRVPGVYLAGGKGL